MSVRSYTKILLHLIWCTHNREKSLNDKELRKKLTAYFHEYSIEKGIFMKNCFVNSDHVHCLIDLPTNKTIEELLHLLKGSSSNWVNKQVNYKFQWATGYAAFSVSESQSAKVSEYIDNQEEHHKVKSFIEEYDELIEKHKVLINRWNGFGFLVVLVPYQRINPLVNISTEIF